MSDQILTPEMMAAMEIGQNDHLGNMVRGFTSYGVDRENTTIEVQTNRGTHRLHLPTIPLSELGLDNLAPGSLVLASSFMRRGLSVARVIQVRTRSLSVAWLTPHADHNQNHDRLWVTPGAVPHEQVVPLPMEVDYSEILTARNRWVEAVNVGIRSKGRQATPEMIERVQWLMQLFQVQSFSRNKTVFNPDFAWLLAMVHPSPEDLRSVFVPNDAKSLTRVRYVRMGTAIKTLQRNYGVQLPDGWTPEDVTYAWSELIPQSYTRWGFEIVSGQGIRDTYNDRSTPGSCMVRQPFTQWYADNPDVCSVIRIIDNQSNDLYGRALLWTDVTGRRWVDRIYPSDGGAHITALNRFMTEQGFHDLRNTSEVVKVRMKPSRWGYPYMDSLMYGSAFRSDADHVIIANRDYVDGQSMPYQFRSTSGEIYSYSRGRYINPDVIETPPDGIDDDDSWTCAGCGHSFHEGYDSYDLCDGIYCTNCADAHMDDCDGCSRDYRPDDWQECERCAATVRVLNGDHRDGTFMCDSCWEAHDDETECWNCSDRYASEDVDRNMQEIDGDWYCNHCVHQLNLVSLDNPEGTHVAHPA